MKSSLRLVAGCAEAGFAPHLQNACLANAPTRLANALKQFKGEQEEPSVSITPMRTAFEATPEPPGLVVVLPGAPGVALQP